VYFKGVEIQTEACHLPGIVDHEGVLDY